MPLSLHHSIPHDAFTPFTAGLADVVTLGDAWLGPAIARGLLAPIPGAEGARWWRRLPRRWQRLARRNAHGFPDERGEIYAAPYRRVGQMLCDAQTSAVSHSSLLLLSSARLQPNGARTPLFCRPLSVLHLLHMARHKTAAATP